MAQEMEVHGRRVIPGVVGTKPPHVTSPEERRKLVPVEDLFIDTGLPEDEVRELVQIGDPVLFRYQFRILQNGRISSRYLDNRASQAALAVALQELQGLRHTRRLLRRGHGGRGVRRLPRGDGGGLRHRSPTSPSPSTSPSPATPAAKRIPSPWAGGPPSGWGPAARPQLAKLMRKVADEVGIDYQLEVMAGPSGTDAWGMQVVRGGVATGILSIPLRYMHTPVELVDLADIRQAGRLLAQVVARIDQAFVEELRCF